jgi:hypothetical protein
MPPRLLDANELAEQLDRTYDDVTKWARLGLIPCIRDRGRVYFNLSAVVKALRPVAIEATVA